MKARRAACKTGKDSEEQKFHEVKWELSSGRIFEQKRKLKEADGLGEDGAEVDGSGKGTAAAAGLGEGTAAGQGPAATE